MFINYSIKNNILYLEIDVNYEFGKFENKKKNTIIDEIRKFIKTHNIKNSFKKVIITCSGIIIGNVIFLKNIEDNNFKYVPNLKEEVIMLEKEVNSSEYITSNKNLNSDLSENIEVEEKKHINTKNIYENNQNKTSNIESNIGEAIKQNPGVSNNTIITVKRSNGNVINLDLEDYCVGVIAAEMPASFNIEAIKAQAVIARTYALKAKKTGKVLTDTVSTQSFIDESEMKNKWGSSFQTYYNKIKSAVESTKDEYLSYNNDYIEALYHSTNNGKTESSLDVFGNYYPYLISVSSDYDKNASSYLRTTNIDFSVMSSKLGLNFNNDSVIEILSYTDGGNIKEISIDGKVFTGRQIRELLGLRSADFDLIKENNTVNITTRGFGHGVGMSQYGAQGMANLGYSYKDILSHYYPNTNLKK